MCCHFQLVFGFLWFGGPSSTSCAVLQLYHTIHPSEYEPVLEGDDIVNVAVVIKDTWSKERVLAMQEFSISSAQITIEVQQHSLSIQMMDFGFVIFSVSSFVFLHFDLIHGCQLDMTR